ncbi:hypothetical protein M422DRAFT_774906 [Sphaerobolus stellatus SS14]|nr:hypothetical protein M422DRAFT_774906 [Sphaerobolus stellatus SS14]
MVITELPEDILAEIIGQLRYEDVCSCRLACRLSNILMNGTPLIQYKSELDRAGLVDAGPSSDLCLTTTHNMFSFLLIGRYIVSEPSRVIAWELAGGILAYLFRRIDDRKVLTFIQLRSTAQDCQQPRIWTHEDIGLADLLDFTIDSAQDLVVLVKGTWASQNLDIHFLLSINMGQPHPKAQQPTICCESGHSDHPFIIRILGKIMGVLFQKWMDNKLFMLELEEWSPRIVLAITSANNIRIVWIPVEKSYYYIVL